MRHVTSIGLYGMLLLGVGGVADAQALGSGGGKSVPLLVHADVPLYPAVALAARLSGTVRVKIQVSNGAVVNTETDSSAHMILVSATEKNVKTWQFASDANGPFELTYIYQLETEEAGLPENPRVEMQLPVVKIIGRPVKRTTVR
jgi:Gram-negative bacterial TonB protein C-terminal